MTAASAQVLQEQVEALSRALKAGAGLLEEDQVEAGRDLGERAARRLHLSPEHTTVGFFGATGSGKSSLFNAVVGSQIAQPGVVRPTTFKVTAAVWGEAGSNDLLEWLKVDEGTVAGDAPPLILLDLPDFDSVAEENRAVVDRLTGQVDVLVWVVDPQKYGDRVIHQDYISPLAHHASTTLVVFNQVDLVDDAERSQIMGSLRGMLTDDGLQAARIFETSALTGEGVDALKGAISSIAEERRAATKRLSADLTKWSAEVLKAAGTTNENARKSEPNARAERQLNQAVQKAAGVETIGNAVSSSYRKRANQATGWPLVSWLGGLRSDPMRRLGIEKAVETGARTSLPPLTSTGRAQLNTAVRAYAGEISGGVPEGWRHGLSAASKKASRDLQENLDGAVAKADYGMEKAWWWSAAKVLQGVFLAFALVGALWYLAAWVTVALALPLVVIPKVEGWPVPGLLIVAGLLAGVLFSLLFGGFASIGGRRRKRLATRSLRAELEATTRREVVEPLTQANQRLATLQEALLEVQGAPVTHVSLTDRSAAVIR